MTRITLGNSETEKNIVQGKEQGETLKLKEATF